ncbi:hypothetical protein EDC30_102231 [Paucimonas lemoignei]|uniref:Uncharacterized protein n=2 Tax=Paucimonas lemoignei TaxID=29443 RepID=A0A4R3HZ28_PAULE|nr:hypothetical protein EDC30_102231 [Paucimonas lemoignei]
MATCLINFRPELAHLVEDGLVSNTIRALRGDGRDPLPGDTLHLYTGMSTKGTRLLRQEPCQYTMEVTIQPSAGDVHHVMLGSKLLEQSEIEMLARVNGFNSAAKFVLHFQKTYGLPFTGLLIGWEPAPVYVTRH